jgi:hypothetical protein
MLIATKLLKLKPNKPDARLDDHLLRDLGVSRVESEFAPCMSLQLDGNNLQNTTQKQPAKRWAFAMGRYIQ